MLNADNFDLPLSSYLGEGFFFSPENPENSATIILIEETKSICGERGASQLRREKKSVRNSKENKRSN